MRRSRAHFGNRALLVLLLTLAARVAFSADSYWVLTMETARPIFMRQGRPSPGGAAQVAQQELFNAYGYLHDQKEAPFDVSFTEEQLKSQGLSSTAFPVSADYTDLADAIMKGDEAAVAALMGAMKDTHLEIRSLAIKHISWFAFDRQQVVIALVQQLSSDEWVAQLQATAGLGWIGPEARTATPALIALISRKLPEDDYGWVAANACQALGAIGATDARPALEQALKDSRKEVRKRAQSALKVLQSGR